MQSIILRLRNSVLDEIEVTYEPWFLEDNLVEETDLQTYIKNTIQWFSGVGDIQTRERETKSPS